MQPYGALYCFEGRTEGFQRASGKPFGAPAGAQLLPTGSDAPTMARVMGLPPRRGIVLSFDAKESTKESMRHGDSGKKPFIAHFGGEARYVARSGVGQLTHAIVRARSSPFSAVKMGGPFSLRCLSPLCSPAVGGWQAHPLQGGMLRCILGIFAAAMNGRLFLFPDDGGHTYPLWVRMVRRDLGIFATPKASVKSNPRWP